MLEKRHEKVAFIGIATEGDVITFKRMTGFSEFSKSMNPETYERKYVDEKNSRNDVTGYAPEISFSADRDVGSAASDFINEIIEKEKVGDDAKADIVVVDMLNGNEDAGFAATKRTYSVIVDTEDGDNVLVQGGSFRACGETVFGTAQTEDEWKTCTFTKEV